MLLPDYNCVCCIASVEETLMHLFIQCPFAQACWNSIGVIVVQADPFVTLDQLKNQLGVPFFMEIIIVMSWCIWMQRNDLIFKGIQPSNDACLRHFKKEFGLVILRAKTRHKTLMSIWLETHV